MGVWGTGKDAADNDVVKIEKISNVRITVKLPLIC
jgi:hypothetical protein